MDGIARGRSQEIEGEMGDGLSQKRWRRISAILDQVIDLSPDLREPRLAEACGDDPDLERRVRILLEAADAAGGFLERPLHPEAARRLWRILGLQLPPPPQVPSSAPKKGRDP